MTSITSKICFLVLVTSMFAACSTTQHDQPASLVNAAVENPDEVTCKTIVKTSTRIGTRVCKTNRAWAMGSSEGRNMVEAIQRGSAISQSDPNAGG